MNFEVEFSPQANKFIINLEITEKERIKAKIQRLQEDPFPPDAIRVEGYKGEKVFRVRVGKYRILYIVRREKNQILIVRIEKRSKAYD